MTFENAHQRCRNCRFWWPTAEGTDHEHIRDHAIFGQCRRLAPRPQIADLPDHGRRHPVWPTTKRDDWCGEHQHIQQ
jgi:hypothetical protein